MFKITRKLLIYKKNNVIINGEGIDIKINQRKPDYIVEGDEVDKLLLFPQKLQKIKNKIK